VFDSIGFMKVELFYAESGRTYISKGIFKQAKKLAIKKSGKAFLNHRDRGSIWLLNSAYTSYLYDDISAFGFDKQKIEGICASFIF